MKSFFSGKKKGHKDNCDLCGLYSGCSSPKMKYTGEGRKKILILAEASGKNEDENWEELGYEEPTQLIGDAGKLLRRKAGKLGINIDRDCWKVNALGCRPPGNKKPTKKQLKLCKPRVDEVIRQLKPKFIWLIGGAAVESFYMGRFSQLGISRWRRLCIPDMTTGAWVIPMFHPSYLLHNEYDESLKSIYDKDLNYAVSCLRKLPPRFIDFESRVELGLDFETVISFLQKTLKRSKIIAIDFETTALKPFGEGHKIWTCSIATGKNRSFAFSIDYPYWNDDQKKQIVTLLKKILYKEDILKIAQGLKFENLWAVVILKAVVRGWHWCTMNAEHILDARANFCGLKFQAYVRFGLESYDNDVKKFIAPKKGEKVNQLDRVPIETLLTYNGIDTIVTFMQYERQTAILNRRGETRKAAYDLTHDGLLAFSEAEQVGIPINEKYYAIEDKRLGKEIKKLESKLLSSREAKKFYQTAGRKIILTSNKDLSQLLFKILRHTPLRTNTLGGSVDRESLDTIDIPFAADLLQMKKLDKIKGTYLAQFIRETTNGRIHPFSDLHTTQSFRSSMSKPSFQNIPIREEEANKSVRRGIVPPKGFQLLCVDYDSHEVRIIACYTKDEELIMYINTPGSDMHKDQAKEIFVLDDHGITYDLRFYTKNQFVFPEFYGSYYVSCAKGLWNECGSLATSDGLPIWEHLVKEGVMDDVNDYRGFEDHIKQVERRFWERFPWVKEWQKKLIGSYKKKGYVELKHGHRRGGHLNNNMIINTPIQGTAFHCVLWSYIRLNEIRKRQKWHTQMLAQIHDEIVFGLHPKERNRVMRISNRVMTEDIKKDHEWLIVPLKVGMNITGIDKSWYNKKEVKYGQAAAA